MADEATNGVAEGATPETSGGEAAVNALFDQAPAETGEGEGAPETSSQVAAATEGDDAWSAGYVPKAFRGPDGAFTGDTDAVFKSWMDGRQQVSRLNAQIAELKRTDASDGASGVADEKQYIDEFDYAGLAERAPNMIAPEGGREANSVLATFLEHARAAGVPMGRAHAMANAYFEALNADAPEYKEPEEQRKDAVAYLGPNGTQMVEDVKGFLGSRARHAPFSKAQMDVIESLVHSGPGLSLLHNLSRTVGASTAPPSQTQVTQVDIDREREAVMRDLGLPDAEFRKQKEGILARARRAFPEWADEA